MLFKCNTFLFSIVLGCVFKYLSSWLKSLGFWALCLMSILVHESVRFVTHICHWLTALTEPFMIHHSEKSTRQCARIWSDSLQLPWYSGCRLYDFRQLPTCLFTTSNFHTKTAIKTLGHLGRNLATTYGEKCHRQVRQDGQYGQFRQDRQGK